MAPRFVSDLSRALLALIRKEVAEWERAIGWGRCLVAIAFGTRRTAPAGRSWEAVVARTVERAKQIR